MDQIDPFEFLLHLIVSITILVVAMVLFPLYAFGIVLIGWTIYALIVYLYKECKPDERERALRMI